MQNSAIGDYAVPKSEKYVELSVMPWMLVGYNDSHITI